MHRSRRLLLTLALFAFTLVGNASIAYCQTGGGGFDGGTSLVVSRASAPAPTASPAPSLSQAWAAAWQWNLIALASTRGWVLSFAPASGARSSRLIAVRRRAF